MATAGRHLSRDYLITAGVALAFVVSVLAIVLTVGAHPGIAERAGRRLGRPARAGPDRSRRNGANEQAACLAHEIRAVLAGVRRKLRIRLR